MSKLKHWWRSHTWRFSWMQIPRQPRIAVLAIVIAEATTGIAAGYPVEEIAIGIAACIAVEVVNALSEQMSEKKRADQRQDGCAERRYIQAWRSRRALRRPSMDSRPLAAEGEGLEEKSAGLGAELDEMPAASRAIHRPSNECWREKMEPSAHLVSNLAIHDPPPMKVSRLKRWRRSCARSVSRFPWQRMAVVLVRAVLTARRIMEIVEFLKAFFASGAC